MEKNYGVSNKARLLNITQQIKGQTYMQVLLRFIQERFLYRLSVSSHREHFILKGGALLYAHERFKARPTMDMDFMGDRINRDKKNIKQAFQSICRVECKEDGITFESGDNDIVVEDITMDQKYNGIRLRLTAHLDTIVQPFSIDVGFGDIVIPEPVNLDYPLLLEDLPEVNVAAYSLETVIAEKFQTMIDRAENNSRMKDYFDVYTILRSGKVDITTLNNAVREVFHNRSTVYIDGHPLFKPEFAASVQRQAMWNAFLRRMKYPVALEFSEVMNLILRTLEPMWKTLQ